MHKKFKFFTPHNLPLQLHCVKRRNLYGSFFIDYSRSSRCIASSKLFLINESYGRCPNYFSFQDAIIKDILGPNRSDGLKWLGTWQPRVRALDLKVTKNTFGLLLMMGKVWYVLFSFLFSKSNGSEVKLIGIQDSIPKKK